MGDKIAPAEGSKWKTINYGIPGWERRDEFAKAVMQGLIIHHGTCDSVALAKRAYELADKMEEARENFET